MTPRAAIAAVALGLAMATTAAAAPRKVLVLPVDGNADAATRSRLTTQIARLARGLDGEVGTAEATFADTALAVGCDPRAPRCSDEVIATLGVDELVWGTATRDGAQTRLVVRRAGKGGPAREVSTTVAAGEPSERIDARIAPVFAAAAAAPPPGPEAAIARPPSPPEPTVPPPAEAAPARVDSGSVAPSGRVIDPGQPGPLMPAGPADRRDRNVGIGLVAGGAVSLALGVALWASYASLQSQIDDHDTDSRADFDDLTALEDRAATYAIAGDVAVVVGLAAGGLGAYYLIRHRRHRRHRVAVAPTAFAHGAGLTLTIHGGL
jgi:hypothetical protein